MRSVKNRAINGHVFACKQPDRDLRFVAIEGAALEASSFVGETYDGSGFGVGAPDVTSIDPKMPRAQPFYAARPDNDGTFCHKYIPSSNDAVKQSLAPGGRRLLNNIESPLIRYNVDKDTAEIHMLKTRR